MLRQFMVDDKGVVLIWVFGLHGSIVSEGSARHALRSASDVRAALGALQLTAACGVDQVVSCSRDHSIRIWDCATGCARARAAGGVPLLLLR